jgi:hypothetical protein
LRAAVEENNANPDWGIVTLPGGQPYTLTLGPITVSDNSSIQGEDPLTTRIDAGHDKAFLIEGPGNGSYNAHFSNMTIYNAYATDGVGSGRGSAMDFESPTSTGIYRVHFLEDSTDWRGGALYNLNANITIQQCRFIGNKVPRSDNTGVEGGGGAILNAGFIRIFETTFAENQGTVGGAIDNIGRLEITNSTFSHNLATYQGGAIANHFKTEGSPTEAIINYCTFYKNAVWVTPDQGRNRPDQLSRPHSGGGALSNSGNMFMANSIVAGNIDSNTAWGPHTLAPDGWSKNYQVTVVNSQSQPVTINITPIFTSHRNNVLGTVNPAVWNIKDSFYDDIRFDKDGFNDPMLGALAMNGGQTETHELLPGSPAQDYAPGTQGSPTFACPDRDQRGVPRPPTVSTPNGLTCDAGAFEASGSTGELEAELAELHGAFVIGTDLDASNDGIAYVPNGTGDRTNAPDETHRLRFEAYVDESGDYNIMGWARGATASDNSFWVKVDGLPSAGNLWDLTPVSGQIGQHFVSHRGNATEENPQFDPVRFTLAKGMHTIDVYLREDGAQLDKIKIMPAPMFSQNLEVESSSLLAGAFMVGKDPLASGGKYVFTPIAFSNVSGVPDNAHKATTIVTAPQAGTYLIRANVHANFDDRNSFWVKVDGLPANGYLWEMTENNSVYGRDYVSHRGGGNSGNPDLDPVELQLSAGPHTIEVFAREGGTRLDRIGLELKQDADMRIVSRGKPATASSSVSSSFDPAKAVDGNAGTRWSSQSGDDQWIRVDLQARYRIDRVMLYWDAAFGKEYEIQISEDGSAWTALYHKSDGTGGGDNLMLDGTGRYVRVTGIKRGTTGGYSLKEFDVYGAAVPSAFVCQGACLSAQPVTRYQNAVLNTTGERWFVVSDVVLGWQASEIAGRTITVNGVALQPGQMPLPSRVNGKYYFRFSPGTFSWAAWSFWN